MGTIFSYRVYTRQRLNYAVIGLHVQVTIIFQPTTLAGHSNVVLGVLPDVTSTGRPGRREQMNMYITVV